jgi:hypothetical protein
LFWCFGWTLLGFSINGLSDARKNLNAKSPFPSYVYFYPPFLIANSLLVFGALTATLPQPNSFYPIAVFFCLNLGFWVDVITFLRAFDKLVDSLRIIFREQ